MQRLSFLFILVFLFTLTDSYAQRGTTYQSLLQRSDQPSAYVDDIYLPVDDSTAVFGTFFRLDYDFLPFLKKRPSLSPPSPEMEYFAPVRMGLEIFEGETSNSRRGRQSATSLFRDSFSDTVWAADYEQTKSRLNHAQGLVQTELSGGDYHYELQLTRGESIREVPSRQRNISIPDLSSVEDSKINLLASLSVSGGRLEAEMLNYGSNVLYGQDYALLVLLPQDSEGLTLTIHQMRAGSSEDTQDDPVFEESVSEEHIFRGGSAAIAREGEDIRISIEAGDIPYAYFSVPNTELENARYKLELRKEGEQEPIAERIIYSQWIDMPVSLYNLDVSISMMKFLVDDEELRRLRSGSTSEKERKFREFWEQRDPTPDTEFNELMNEYFSRIDYAYQQFSSMQTPGYETDQGRAYILYGPPQRVDRRFPTDGPTREIWEYGNRTLIFEATSGFGDFRLISQS